MCGNSIWLCDSACEIMFRMRFMHWTFPKLQSNRFLNWGKSIRIKEKKFWRGKVNVSKQELSQSYYILNTCMNIEKWNAIAVLQVNSNVAISHARWITILFTSQYLPLELLMKKMKEKKNKRKKNLLRNRKNSLHPQINNFVWPAVQFERPHPIPTLMQTKVYLNHNQVKQWKNAQCPYTHLDCE